MVDRDVFAARIQKLERTLADLRRLASNSREAYLASHELKTLAERWLHLAAECCIDLANHVIADRGWGQPDPTRILVSRRFAAENLPHRAEQLRSALA